MRKLESKAYGSVSELKGDMDIRGMPPCGLEREVQEGNRLCLLLQEVLWMCVEWTVWKLREHTELETFMALLMLENHSHSPIFNLQLISLLLLLESMRFVLKSRRGFHLNKTKFRNPFCSSLCLLACRIAHSKPHGRISQMPISPFHLTNWTISFVFQLSYDGQSTIQRDIA